MITDFKQTPEEQAEAAEWLNAFDRAMCFGVDHEQSEPAKPESQRESALPLGLSISHISSTDKPSEVERSFEDFENFRVARQKAQGEYRQTDFYLDGGYVRISGVAGVSGDGDGDGGTRGVITGFTPDSRRRMQERCAQAHRKALPVFLTLTYGKAWSNEIRKSKAHLNTLLMWVEDSYPDACMMWKLEPQKREAPHYHCLHWGERIPWQILRVRWVEIITGAKIAEDFPILPGRDGAAAFRVWATRIAGADADLLDMLLASTRSEAIRSRKGVAAYASKRYMGKECFYPESWIEPGRCWGVRMEKNWPASRMVSEVATVEVHARFRRLGRKALRAKGIRVAQGLELRLFVSDPLQWVRAMDWARAGKCDAIDFGEYLPWRETV